MSDVALTVFVTLFVTIDPVGLTPIFVALTGGMGRAARNRIALRACLIAIGILAVFGLAGEALLQVIGIGLPAFRIAGGLLLFLIAVEMLFERRTERREKAADASVPDHDPSVFPLATPFLAGPGALATMILLMGERTGDWVAQGIILATMVLVVMTAYILFRLSGGLERVLGPVGISVVTRLLGMLLAALSVQFVLDGLADVGVISGAS